MRPPNQGSYAAAPAPPPQPWILALKGHAAPRPQAQPSPVSPVAEAEAGPVCPPPCPEQAGDWMPASATSRRPAWIVGMLTDDDYPKDLKSKNIEGRVVVDVLIDQTGAVKSVTLVQGSETEFNQVALERLRQSRFTPGYDHEGNAVAVRLRMPLSFKLGD
jgi:TonB family protein